MPLAAQPDLASSLNLSLRELQLFPFVVFRLLYKIGGPNEVGIKFYLPGDYF